MEEESESKLLIVVNEIKRVVVTIIAPGAIVGFLSKYFPSKQIHGLLFIVQFFSLVIIFGMCFDMNEKMKRGESISKEISSIKAAFITFIMTLILLATL